MVAIARAACLTMLMPLLLLSCGVAVDATIPTIVTGEARPAPGERVEVRLLGALALDGEPVVPERYEWSVTSVASGAQVEVVGEGDTASWTGPEAGRYLVQCRLVAGDKRLTTSAVVELAHSAASLQRALAGSWTGTLETAWIEDSPRRVTFTFEPDGLYTASQEAVYFNFRSLDPAEYPARLRLLQVSSASPATASGFLEFYRCEPTMPSWPCQRDTFDVADFSLSQDGQTVTFDLVRGYGGRGPLHYQLQRQP